MTPEEKIEAIKFYTRLFSSGLLIIFCIISEALFCSPDDDEWDRIPTVEESHARNVKSK